MLYIDEIPMGSFYRKHMLGKSISIQIAKVTYISCTWTLQSSYIPAQKIRHALFQQVLVSTRFLRYFETPGRFSCRSKSYNDP